jgi:hypothetical protein
LIFLWVWMTSVEERETCEAWIETLPKGSDIPSKTIMETLSHGPVDRRDPLLMFLQREGIKSSWCDTLGEDRTQQERCAVEFENQDIQSLLCKVTIQIDVSKLPCFRIERLNSKRAK